jgi:tetratricopeptide (TPR) repeat protein
VLVHEILERLEQSAAGVTFAGSGQAVETWLSVVDPQRVTAVLGTLAGQTKWSTAGRALADGDLERALELYRETESVPDVALLHRLLARRFAEEGRRSEANAHLDEALAIYRSLGATHFIREAEKLLPATA